MSATSTPLGSLFVVCAPSGTGKTSLVRALVSLLSNLKVSVSHTTRPQRPGERDGRDYYFVDQTEFQRMLSTDALLEHALVFDHQYGTSRKWVEETLQHGDAILEIDWQGARQIRKAFPGCVSIQVIPPSLATLEERLRRRGQDAEATISRRMAEAVREMADYAEFDYLIINDDFELALDRLQAVVLAERARVRRMRREHQELLCHLLGPALAAAEGDET